MRTAAALPIACLLVVAGCLGTPTGTGTTSTVPTATPTDHQPETVATPDLPTDRAPTDGIDLATTNCSGSIRWVAFYNLAAAGEYDRWTKRQASVGYTLRASASVFLVAYSRGTRLGVEHVSTVGYGSGVTADGHPIGFDEPLDDRRAVRIVAHRDVDRDGTFDPDTDLACTDGNGLVATEIAVVEFDELTPETPGPSTTS